MDEHTHASLAFLASSALRRFSLRACRCRLRPSGPWWLRSASASTCASLQNGQAERVRSQISKSAADDCEGAESAPVAARLVELGAPTLVRLLGIILHERQGAELAVGNAKVELRVLLGQRRPVDGERDEVPVGLEAARVSSCL